MALLIKNAEWIITLDSEGHRYRQADLLIEGPAIKAIGSNLPAGDGDEIINARGKVVLPGLINTHHHLYQTLTRNIPATQDIPLFPWLVTLYEIWRELTPEAVRQGALVGLGELLKTGCTCSSDHHYVFPRGQGNELIDIEIQAARELGIRFHATRGSMSLGKSRGGLPPDEVVQKEDEILADSERLIRQYHEAGPFAMCRVALAPCSPFSVTPQLMRDSAALARRYGVMLHTHLAETLDEERFCKEKFGRRPVEYMADLGWLGSDVWFAHAIHLNDAEVALLGETKSGVAHCPVSNMKLSSGVCRVKDLLSAGARVGLAVDGSASNDSSNMWNEMRIAYLLQKLAYGNDGLTAEEVLRLATVGSAQVLGREDLGHLAPGMAADMILINFEELGFAGGQHDPVAAIITCGDSQLVDTTIVNGEVVVREGRLLKVDETEIVRQANRISSEMLAWAGRRTGTDYYAYPKRQ
ncbi:Amidohydrolase 1 [Moorella glycerini]|uniref:8-oxoguanine deaminase n=1 Tax=Neomoorella stamsii TaxID=1266720 RepID=A0A9X7J402_9FIRM|nr:MULTISPECIES: 8-oxoguanine deaminase [Moorella]PRR72975.1 8-oxoguanine deaminase [Moorella stamsii]CEP67646.1 Amidohydrolase 1 [Moorella glycerini]